MSTVRFTTEVLSDGSLQLPPEVKLSPGKAKVTIEQSESKSGLKLSQFIALMESLPKLDDDVESFQEDLREIRRGIPPEGSAWE